MKKDEITILSQLNKESQKEFKDWSIEMKKVFIKAYLAYKKEKEN